MRPHRADVWARGSESEEEILRQEIGSEHHISPPRRHPVGICFAPRRAVGNVKNRSLRDDGSGGVSDGQEGTDGGRSGFWDGRLGYRQAAFTVATAVGIGVLFHWKLGYRVAIPPLLLATVGGAASALWAAASRVWQRSRVVRWLTDIPFAICTLAGVGALTIVGAATPAATLQRLTGIDSVYASWPFRMSLLLLLLNLIGASARRVWPLAGVNLRFTLNHTGLALVVLGAGYSAASMTRARLVLTVGRPTSVAETADDRTVDLPFALTLRDFRVDWFPPTLSIATLEPKSPNGVKTQDGAQFTKSGVREAIGPWKIEVRKYLPNAALVGETWRRVPFSTGVPVALVRASRAGTRPVEGWVSCGGIDSPGSVLQLSDTQAVVMPRQRPRSFRADITIAQPQGAPVRRPLQVNHPVEAGGYRLYLLSYDEEMGSASEHVVVEAVRDPGLPVVYTGIYLLLAGAALQLWSGLAGTKRPATRKEGAD